MSSSLTVFLLCEFRRSGGAGLGGDRAGVGGAADRRSPAEAGRPDHSQECPAAAAGGGL